MINNPFTPAGAALSHLSLEVLRLANELTAAGDTLAGRAGLTHARWLVLESVGRTPRTVADVARSLGLARQSVQRLADALADEGFASFADNPAHRRARLLRPTTRGRAALETVRAEQAAWANRRAEQLDPARMQDTLTTLAALRRRLEADAAAG